MSHTLDEITSQPACWARVLRELPDHAPALPAPGERVVVIGCGTSLFMAQSYARLREDAGQGVTDVFPASEAKLDRPYDRVLAMTRSGTTTEILDALGRVRTGTRVTTITAVADSPAARASDDVVCLPYADEVSVVQTRFPTTQLLLLRAHLGLPVERALGDVTRALAEPLDAFVTASQISFLGADWHVGLANEAALKVREAAAWWTESYSAMEYRHGPIAVAAPGRAVWSLAPLDADLVSRIEATGAFLRQGALDPLAELVAIQRLAVELAERAGRDPDRPAHLTRSVVLAS
ncbi:SIS domain-containing protein [Amycolatopsis sp. NPDC005961]|uniref:Glutamine--fructose-6-phosphate aminotransferase [isomerizing] n=1 Tax=Amycolatopsis camponoti TaxID=2606593 RepID=A0A6I8LPA2_9PSEU|nr:SIS domain-containing protein [Amycolatopsis camponoti]VVJ17807.1 Glucosamine-6-phosphate deaminase [isomerizing] [Amycolatopsis camponoti]